MSKPWLAWWRPPRCARLRRLRMTSSYFGDESIILLAGWPGLASVQSLDLSDGAAGPAGVEALVRSPYLGHVTSLDLSGNSLEVGGAQALASSRLLKQLQDLNLSRNAISDDGLETLAQSPQGNLTRLHLSANLIEVEGMQALASWAQLPLLEELDLTDNPLRRAGLRALLAGRADRLRHALAELLRAGCGGAQALAASPNLPALASLDLTGNELMLGGPGRGKRAAGPATDSPRPEHQPTGAETYQALASAPLEDLVSLDLSYCYSGAESLAPLLAAAQLPRLRSLVLAYNSLGNGDIAQLANSPLLARLTSLSLASNRAVGDEGLAALFGSPNAANLRDLDLTSTSLTSAGAATLANSPYLAQLRSLNVRSTTVGSSGVKALASSPHLRRLAHPFAGQPPGYGRCQGADDHHEPVCPGQPQHQSPFGEEGGPDDAPGALRAEVGFLLVKPGSSLGVIGSPSGPGSMALKCMPGGWRCCRRRHRPVRRRAATVRRGPQTAAPRPCKLRLLEDQPHVLEVLPQPCLWGEVAGQHLLALDVHDARVGRPLAEDFQHRRASRPQARANSAPRPARRN